MSNDSPLFAHQAADTDQRLIVGYGRIGTGNLHPSSSVERVRPVFFSASPLDRHGGNIVIDSLAMARQYFLRCHAKNESFFP
jgi:hypothetical protein